MFCRNCGKELNDQAVACTGCGFDPRKGHQHCPNCGVDVNAAQVVCVKCGCSLAPSEGNSAAGDKDYTTHLVLGLLLGSLGVHNFYAGYTMRGVAKILITCLSFGLFAVVSEVWAIIEVVTVDKDATGKPFRK